MANEDEDGGGAGLPLAIYLIVGVLALIGFFTIIGTIFSGALLLIKLAFYAFIVLAILWVLKSIFIGRNPKKRSAGSDA